MSETRLILIYRGKEMFNMSAWDIALLLMRQGFSFPIDSDNLKLIIQNKNEMYVEPKPITFKED